MQALADLVNELVRFEASLPQVVEAYAELYFEDQRLGKVTVKTIYGLRHAPKSQAPFS